MAAKVRVLQANRVANIVQLSSTPFVADKQTSLCAEGGGEEENEGKGEAECERKR